MALQVPQLGPWDTISQVKLDDLHTVVKYRSPDTGLELVHCNIEGPNVHACCIIAHQCDDNCGIPNVLQHMLWHGSKNYPHPGLLQQIASKCFSPNPKMQIEKDHSLLRFTSAGSQGFSAFLPVFFDHIFNPLLQESVFITEVYHIDDKGQDGGTCFNGMKLTEMEPAELTSLALQELAFGTDSGYSKSHRGKSAVFRSECNLEKVRNFHEQFYHASNCCLCVIGNIDKDDLFRSLIPVLHNALRSHRVKPVWKKPWSAEPIVELSEPIHHKLEYPYSFVERPVLFAHAQVTIGFVTPPLTSKDRVFRDLAIRLLLEYLTKGPIIQALNAAIPSSRLYDKVDGTTAPGTTTVTFSTFDFKQNVFSLDFKNLPMEMVKNITIIVRKALLQEVKKHTFKVKKMIQIVTSHQQDDVDQIENCPEEKIPQAVVQHFLYSTKDDDIEFDRRINKIYAFHHLLSQTEEYWQGLITKYFLKSKWITVTGVPCQSLHEKLQSEMSERVQWRLGSENVRYMKSWAQRLKVATKVMAQSPPAEYLSKYQLPMAESIGHLGIVRQDNPDWASDTMCNLYVDDINSNRAYLTVMMDTSELTLDQRKYLVLFAEAICQAPYFDSGEKFHSAKEMEKNIKKDVAHYDTCFGLEWFHPSYNNEISPRSRSKFFCGNFPHLLCLRVRMDVSKVKEGFHWAQMLLWNTKWQGDVLKNLALKIAKDADEVQNDGLLITRALLNDFLYHADSNPKCVSLVRQKLFLRQIADELPKGIRRVSKVLESIRTTILRPDNVTVHFATSLSRMEFHLSETFDTKFVLSELFRTTFNYADWTMERESKKLSKTPDNSTMKSADHIRKFCTELILPISKDSFGYLIQIAPGVTSFTDPDYPLVLTTIEYFIQEPCGPLFKHIVQTELAEQLNIRVNTLEGLIYFELLECPDLTLAYSRTYEIMTKYLLQNRDGEVDASGTNVQWDQFLLQSAKSSLIFKLTQLENTPVKMGMFSLGGYYRELTTKNTRMIMDAVTKVTMKQVETTARRYFYPLFLQPATCAAAAPSERVFDIIDDLMHGCAKKLTLALPPDQSTMAAFE